MAGETIITVVGNLTADPELRYTQNGLAVANFTIASTPRTFDRQANEWKDGEALFLRASVLARVRRARRGLAHQGLPGHRFRASQAAFLRDEGRREAHHHRARGRRDRPLAWYATAQVTRAQSNRGVGGGSSGGGQSDDAWAPSAPAAQQSGGGDVWNTPGTYGDETPVLIHHGAGTRLALSPASDTHQGKQSMAGKSSGDRRKPRARARRTPPREVHQGRRHRLQGCRHPSQVHLGAREDPRPSHHRCLRAGAAPHRPRREERARDGPPALLGLRPLRSTTMAKVILTHEVTGLGAAGDVVEVKNGYARNYLVPQGFATRGPAAARSRSSRSRPPAPPRAASLEDAQALKAKLESNKVKLAVKAAPAAASSARSRRRMSRLRSQAAGLGDARQAQDRDPHPDQVGRRARGDRSPPRRPHRDDHPPGGRGEVVRAHTRRRSGFGPSAVSRPAWSGALPAPTVTLDGGSHVRCTGLPPIAPRGLEFQDGCAQVCMRQPWIAEEAFPHRCGNTKSPDRLKFNPCNSPDFHSSPQAMCTRSTAFRPDCPTELSTGRLVGQRLP